MGIALASGAVNLARAYGRIRDFVHAGSLDHSREAATLVATNSGAVKREDTAAMNVLGNMFSAGVGVSRDDMAAFRWHMRAARRGNADAMNAVGIAYATGRGVSHVDV
jgi:TPR repeat protein